MPEERPDMPSRSNPPADDLSDQFSGELVRPGDPEYDEERKVFNAMIDRRPALIARCTDAVDVVAALGHARANGLQVAVRCGGHSASGVSTCDDGVLIDLAPMKRIEVDPEARIARAGGGVLWGEFDAATQEHGLHTPGGRVTTTGLGGFTTGGGYGWTSSVHGLASDNLVSAQVVTADGDVVTASENENADLFWGIRGGSGNFGIVTRFDFRLHPIGPEVLGGQLMWPLERAPAVLRGLRDYLEQAPDELAVAFLVFTAPPLDFVPEQLRGQTALGMAAMYVGDLDDGLAAMQPLRDLEPELDGIQPMPYTAFQAILDETAPPGQRNYWRSEYLAELSDAAIDTYLEHAEQHAPLSPFNQMIVFRLGGAINRVGEDESAFAHRDAPYIFHPISVWEDPSIDEQVIEGNREFCAAMREYGTGAVYVNWIPEGERVRDAYGAGRYERLVALKDKYDPDNVFQLNQNIKPSAAKEDT
jgi:FAD/FMN-containing dehydrogenase